MVDKLVPQGDRDGIWYDWWLEDIERGEWQPKYTDHIARLKLLAMFSPRPCGAKVVSIVSRPAAVADRVGDQTGYDPFI